MNNGFLSSNFTINVLNTVQNLINEINEERETLNKAIITTITKITELKRETLNKKNITTITIDDKTLNKLINYINNLLRDKGLGKITKESLKNDILNIILDEFLEQYIDLDIEYKENISLMSKTDPTNLISKKTKKEILNESDSQKEKSNVSDKWKKKNDKLNEKRETLNKKIITTITELKLIKKSFARKCYEKIKSFIKKIFFNKPNNELIINNPLNQQQTKKEKIKPTLQTKWWPEEEINELNKSFSQVSEPQSLSNETIPKPVTLS